MRKQQGISLVELMISITIGLILMTGVVQLFLSSRATFSTQQALSRVQETGRLAMEFLADDIRMAGYMGCMSRNMSFTSTLKDQSSFAFNFGVGIEGLDDFDGTVPTGYPAGFSPLLGTDVLVVRGANGNGVGVTRNNDSGQLFAENTRVAASCDEKEKSYSGLCENDILVVSDCSKARVFQATSLQDVSTGGVEINITHSSTGTPGNDPTSWGGSSSKDPNETFGPDSEIIKVNASAYYIANGTSGAPSLWQQINGGTAQELLEGVQDMQLLYGRDTSGDSIPDTYQEADVITAADAWEEVSSVRVQLLVQSSDDNVLEDAQPYTFNGVTNSAPGDRRLRQVFINTVGIRSRLP
ncbi:PilW family protein [uncultured Microbulbifer sp.]|uniref:PilW family protein n=1 Tax=uncultured Microbulbifer sp. TaxID=348147 RepID=UPI0025CB9B1C|nr:PilW family protein [uncultured Microbulbifer sp.]